MNATSLACLNIKVVSSPVLLVQHGFFASEVLRLAGRGEAKIASSECELPNIEAETGASGFVQLILLRTAGLATLLEIL
jgi:hypothetical protein